MFDNYETPIDYGLNKYRNDRGFDQFERNRRCYYTFFIHDDNFYCMFFNVETFEIGYGHSRTDSLDPEDYLDEDELSNASTSTVELLSKILYLGSEMNQTDLFAPFMEVIIFSSPHSRLEQFYQKVVENPSFRKALNHYGYEYHGFLNGYHLLRRTYD
jgi:hypothetical protein